MYVKALLVAQPLSLKLWQSAEDSYAFKRKQCLDIEFLSLDPSQPVAQFVILQMRPIYQNYADKAFK